MQVISVVLDQHSAISDHLNLKAAGRAALVLASATASTDDLDVTTRYAAAGVLGWPRSGVPVVANDTIVLSRSSPGSRARDDHAPHVGEQ